MFRYIVVLILAMATGIPLPSLASTEGPCIGIYFDESATINCLPDSNSYPCEITAYLILTAAESSFSVNGWEGRISVPQNFMLTGVAIRGDYVNYRSPPDFVVGLVDGIEGGAPAVLAEVSFAVFEPGQLGWTGLGLSTDTDSPVMTYGVDREIMLANYQYGGTDSPVASIGTYECPELAVQVGGESATSPMPSGEETAVTTFGLVDPQAKTDEVSLERPIEDLGFVGKVLSVEHRALELDPGAYPYGSGGFLEVMFHVDEVVWGFPSDIVTVWFAGYDVPGVLYYDPPWPVVGAGAFAEGSVWYVNARRLIDGYICSPAMRIGELQAVGELSVRDVSQKSSPGLLTVTPEQLFEMSDAVVDAKFVARERGVYLFETKRIIKGKVEPQFRVLDTGGRNFWRVLRTPDAQYRLYLEYDEGSWALADSQIGLQIY